MRERIQILLCAGTGCLSGGSNAILDEFDRVLKELNLEDEVRVVQTGCFGLCEKGPICIVYPDETFYSHMTVSHVYRICEEHIKHGVPVKEFEFHDEESKNKVNVKLHELGFYGKQNRRVLRNCGVINPYLIDEYIARDGYLALHKVLSSMTPEEVIQVIKDSGLRGRGGGGFPTGLKWGFAAKYDSDQKYIVCNADEGDPGAFMDRSLLEGDPHSVVEAMIIAGYAIGASQGFVYVRAEYPVAVERLNKAIDAAREYGLIGKNIFGSGFDFELEPRLGAGAFVCGEETALIARKCS